MTATTLARNLRLLYAFQALKSLQLFGAVTVPFYLEWAGLDYTRMFVLEGAYSLFMFLLEVPTGTIADRFGRKWSLVAWSLGSTVSPHALSYPRRARILGAMEGSDFDEADFFRRISVSGARALLIGRRALVALGLPVLTADYDFWVHPEDVALFNAAAEPLGLLPSRTPEEVKSKGRYVLENDEHIDVIAARSVSTYDGQPVLFDDLWARRTSVALSDDACLVIPSLDDLIATKRFSARPKDLEDLRLLQSLREKDVLA